MKLKFSREIYEEASNMKFNENTSTWSWVVPFLPTEIQADRQKEGQADMAKLIFAFCSYVNAPKIFCDPVQHKFLLLKRIVFFILQLRVSAYNKALT